MFIRLFVFMLHVYINISADICTNIHIYIYTHVYMYIKTYTHIFIFILNFLAMLCVYVYMMHTYTYMFRDIRICTCVSFYLSIDLSIYLTIYLMPYERCLSLLSDSLFIAGGRWPGLAPHGPAQGHRPAPAERLPPAPGPHEAPRGPGLPPSFDRVCCFGCLQRLSNSVQALSHGIEAVMVLTLIIRELQALWFLLG